MLKWQNSNTGKEQQTFSVKTGHVSCSPPFVTGKGWHKKSHAPDSTRKGSSRLAMSQAVVTLPLTSVIRVLNSQAGHLVWSGLLQCVLPLKQTIHFVTCKDKCVGALSPNLASIHDEFQLCSILLYYSAEKKPFNL
jgi:hypothetical protein